MLRGYKKGITLFALSLLFFAFFTPIITYSKITQSGGTGVIWECNNGAPGECDFYDLVAVVQKVVEWARNFAIFFSVIVLSLIGFNYIRYADNPGKRNASNEMLTKVLIGMFFMLAAWVIVTLITKALEVNVETFL